MKLPVSGFHSKRSLEAPLPPSPFAYVKDAAKERRHAVYDKDTIYVVGDAQTSVNNPITQQYSAFFIGLVIDTTNHKIVDAGCSSTIALTSQFVRSIFTGHSILSFEPVAEEIRRRYHGSSQKALIVAYKDAQKKYKLALNIREDSDSGASRTG